MPGVIDPPQGGLTNAMTQDDVNIILYISSPTLFFCNRELEIGPLLGVLRQASFSIKKFPI